MFIVGMVLKFCGVCWCRKLNAGFIWIWVKFSLYHHNGKVSRRLLLYNVLTRLFSYLFGHISTINKVLRSCSFFLFFFYQKAFSLIRNEKNQLLLGIRRANRPQTVMPSSVLSSDSMHLGLLAAAAHAAATNSRFTIFYNPRYHSLLVGDCARHQFVASC